MECIKIGASLTNGQDLKEFAENAQAWFQMESYFIHAGTRWCIF